MLPLENGYTPICDNVPIEEIELPQGGTGESPLPESDEKRLRSIINKLLKEGCELAQRYDVFTRNYSLLSNEQLYWEDLLERWEKYGKLD